MWVWAVPRCCRLLSGSRSASASLARSPGYHLAKAEANLVLFETPISSRFRGLFPDVIIQTALSGGPWGLGAGLAPGLAPRLKQRHLQEQETDVRWM